MKAKKEERKRPEYNVKLLHTAQTLGEMFIVGCIMRWLGII